MNQYRDMLDPTVYTTDERLVLVGLSETGDKNSVKIRIGADDNITTAAFDPDHADFLGHLLIEWAADAKTASEDNEQR